MTAALSTRISGLKGSPVREMLAAAQAPGVISFAGGLPAPDSFSGVDLTNLPEGLLQYGPTEGEPALREKIAEELAAIGLNCPASRILVLSGSQQGIDLAAKLVIDTGTPVAVEDPSYLAALQVFRLFGASLSSFDPAMARADWGAAAPAMAYVVPTFQNPTGRCWSVEERRAMARACEAHGVILFEDDPYRDLAYDACDRTPVCALMRTGAWIYQGSFSKTVAPGLRLGFLAASDDIFPHLVHLKQAADLHTSRLSQAIVLRYLNDPARAGRLNALTARYAERRDRFGAAMRRHLGEVADWSTPPGGLFFWATLRGGRSAQALLDAAAPRGVLFTPGAHFSLDVERAASSLRLNFSHADDAAAETGLSVLGDILRS